MDVKVGDRVKFIAKSWYSPVLQDVSGKAVWITRSSLSQKHLATISFNGKELGYFVDKSCFSPIYRKDEQLEFSFMGE